MPTDTTPTESIDKSLENLEVTEQIETTPGIKEPEPASPFAWLAARQQRKARVTDGKLYRLGQAAKILNVCTATLRRRSKRGDLQTIRFGSKGWRYVTEAELRKILSQKRGQQ